MALQNLSLGCSNTFMQLIIKYKDQILSEFQYDMFKNPEKLVESVQRLYWKKIFIIHNLFITRGTNDRCELINQLYLFHLC